MPMEIEFSQTNVDLEYKKEIMKTKRIYKKPQIHTVILHDQIMLVEGSQKVTEYNKDDKGGVYTFGAEDD